MASSEMRGFVFAVTFIFLFATLLSTVPAGLQGSENAPSIVTPIDPSLLTGFSDSENWTTSAYSPFAGGVYFYDYADFGGKNWITFTDNTSYFQHTAKVLIFGLWLGQVDICSFIAPDGTDRGTDLSFTEVIADMDDGGVSYSLDMDSGDDGGTFVVYYNTTEHSTMQDAWDADELYLLHGIGFTNTATSNIGALLVGLLFLQLPNVPLLLNAFIATPIWACIIYVLWFVVKEMIPFV